MTIAATARTCRGCGSPLTTVMMDLGAMPLANSYLREQDLARPEPIYPLRAMVCDACLLVQLDAIADVAGIFTDYAYFSSFSSSWLAHARQYVDTIVGRLSLGPRSQVVEIASNDGYLLKNFVERGIPCLGIDPAANVAAVAEAQGVPTRVMFFGAAAAEKLAGEGLAADLVIGNNVLAHVPALHDFLDGIRVLLQQAGVATFEFPHLLRLVEERQFDTIYHEHFSYFSLLAIERVFAQHGLIAFDVEMLPTHGGSLRLFVQRLGGPHQPAPALAAVRAAERAAGFDDPQAYGRLAKTAEQVRRDFLEFLQDARTAGRCVAAYGAPAKGNTLLNYCGVGPDLIRVTVDRNPHKQNRYLPGSRIPIRAVDALRELRPDYVVVLPWNLKEEIVEQLAWIGEWGGRFVLPIPHLEVLVAGNASEGAA
jgi:SAM-dependent methyltransferase